MPLRPRSTSLSCAVLFSILRPPPRPTLFPYTTLFRSGGKLKTVLQALAVALYLCPLPSWMDIPSYVVMLVAVADRKSTRLNSSHVAISYAVFCLKKKIMEEMGKISQILKTYTSEELLK